MSRNLKAEFTEIFKDFSLRYGKLWRGNDAKEDAKKAFFWIENLIENDVDPSYVSMVASELTGKPEFSKFPPNIEDFLSCYRDIRIKEAINSGELDSSEYELEKEFKSIYSKFSMYYRALWDKDSAGDAKLLDFWLSEIKEAGLSKEDLMPAYRAIRGISEFRTYPPNVDQFIDVARIKKSGKDIPLPDDAYRMATQSISGSKIDPIVRLARQRFGSFELRSGSGYRTREKFFDVYRQVVIDFLGGKVSLPQEVEPEEKEIKVSQEDKDNFLKILDRMISK